MVDPTGMIGELPSQFTLCSGVYFSFPILMPQLQEPIFSHPCEGLGENPIPLLKESFFSRCRPGQSAWGVFRIPHGSEYRIAIQLAVGDDSSPVYVGSFNGFSYTNTFYCDQSNGCVVVRATSGSPYPIPGRPLYQIDGYHVCDRNPQTPDPTGFVGCTDGFAHAQALALLWGFIISGGGPLAPEQPSPFSLS